MFPDQAFDSGLLLSILGNSTEATAIYTGMELTVRFANEGMLALFGKGSGITGKPLLEVIPEIKDQPFPHLLQKVWQSGETYQAKDVPAMLEVGGELRQFYFDFEYKAVIGPEGKTLAILHTAQDVTARVLALHMVTEKQLREEQLVGELRASGSAMQTANAHLSAANAELQTSNLNINRLNLRLQESETDFKRLVEQAPVAILVFRGADMVIDLVNDAMLEILGKDQSIVGKALLEGLPEIKGAPAVEQLFQVYRTGAPSDGNGSPVPIRRNGRVETRYFNFSYRPLIDQGNIIGVMDVAVEVTEQVLARQRLEAIIAEKILLEQTLRANQHRLQGILDTMAEGVVIVDTQGRPTYANPMAQKIMGMTEAQFKGRTYNDAKWRNERLDGSELPAGEHPMHLVLRTGEPVFDQEIAIILPAGEKLYISINAAPLYEEQQVSGVIVTFTDVTHRRMVLQQKDDFISVASHELKTPVTSLKAALQLLERLQGNITPETLAKLVGQANKSLNKLSDLVNSLLNSHRMSQGRFPVNKTNFSIIELINDCCHHLRSTASHVINVTGDPELQITADEQLIDQVVVNLINNSVKYAPVSRQIDIAIEKLPDLVKVSVQDYGPGIAADKTAQLFDRYYQVEGSGQQSLGLGLGLFICAEIIHKHGGEIGVESKLGEGSTFWFTLPH